MQDFMSLRIEIDFGIASHIKYPGQPKGDEISERRKVCRKGVCRLSYGATHSLWEISNTVRAATRVSQFSFPEKC